MPQNNTPFNSRNNEEQPQQEAQAPAEPTTASSAANTNSQPASPNRFRNYFIVGACTAQARKNSKDDLNPGPGTGPIC